jgi:hypothetical protein
MDFQTASIVFGVLIATASQRSTITYTDLGYLVGMPMENPVYRKQIGVYLNKISNYTLEQFGFALSALAVGMKDGMPSGSQTDPLSGFYKWAEDAGLDVSDPLALVVVQQNLAWRHFAS